MVFFFLVRFRLTSIRVLIGLREKTGHKSITYDHHSFQGSYPLYLKMAMSYHSHFALNSLTPKSDQHPISPYIISPESKI